MDASSMEDYWNEICILREARLLEEYLDELDDENNQAKSCEDDASGEGERESEWLSETGLGHLSVAFKEGREIDQDALRPTLEGLSQLQALAVSRRIHTLNRTVRKRHKRQPRAKLTQIFPNFENSSTGTRSRSATPDSLDSTPGGSPPPAPNSNSNVVSSSPQQAPIVSSGSSSPSRPFHRPHHKPNLRRTPSAPMSVPTTTNEMMFRGLRNDEIAFDNGESDGIRMLGYQRLGTLQLPRPKPRAPSEHSPTSIKSSSSNLHYKNDTFEDERASLSRSHSSLIDAVAGQSQRAAARALLSDGDLLHPSIGSSHHVSLPHIPSSLHQGSSSHSINTLPVEEQLGRTWLDSLEIEDIIRLRPLVLLEVTGLFESHNIPFNKRKARKRSRIKNEFNVFGHPISALIEKDIQNGVDPLPVPRVFHEMLTYLEREGLEEEGLLRVSGPKQRVESLRLRVDASFGAAHSFDGTSPHDVATLLKRWLRELPQPLLTEDYMQMFYLVNEMPNTVRDVALNLLVLLLPVEHSATLRRLFDFLHRVASYEGINRMALRNIAIVLAPNIFHPRFVRQLSKQSPNEQAEAATICCQLIERMLNCQDDLWRVPGHLLSQLRRQNEIEAYRRGHKENATAMQRLLGRRLREPITRKIINEVDFQEGVIRISAKELGMSERAFKLTPSLTAGDLVLNLLEETAVSRKSYEKQSSRFHKKNATPATGSPPCLHARTETQLATHCLYEVGGNINRRRLEHSAIVMAVYKENPNAQWALQCHHAMQREP